MKPSLSSVWKTPNKSQRLSHSLASLCTSGSPAVQPTEIKSLRNQDLLVYELLHQILKSSVIAAPSQNASFHDSSFRLRKPAHAWTVGFECVLKEASWMSKSYENSQDEHISPTQSSFFMPRTFFLAIAAAPTMPNRSLPESAVLGAAIGQASCRMIALLLSLAPLRLQGTCRRL